MPRFELLVFSPLAALLFGTLATVTPWWDEGWTMAVARTLVEHGHYGRLLGGELAPHGLEASPPMAGLVAVSYKLLGVGIWQARLPMALLTLGAVALLSVLGRILYGPSVGRATLLVALLGPVLPQLHIIRLGGQVMADVPMLFLLLGGYVCLHGALAGQRLLLLPATLLWALAALVKAQYLLFWALSLALPAGLLLLRGERQTSLTLGAGLAGALLLRELLLLPLQSWLMTGRSMAAAPVTGLFTTLAFLPGELGIRTGTLALSATYALPGAIACGYAAWCEWRRYRDPTPSDAATVLRMCLLTLIVVWWGWFAVLSIGWVRYLLPVYAISAIFQAALLHRLTGGLRVRATLAQAAQIVRQRNLPSLGALIVVIVVPVVCAGTLLLMAKFYQIQDTAPLHDVASYLNERTPPGSLVETYDSELFVLLDRPYHHPPDQVHADLVEQQLLGRAISISYEPLAADPDYLVVGVYGEYSKLYDRVVADGSYRLVLQRGTYAVYRRVSR